MTQAEKAMAYDEALGKAEEFYNDKNNIQCVNVEGMLEEIFPELKESEDEEIRKGLIKAFGSIGKKEWGGVNVKNAIVWLEKQGEKKPVIEMITPEESLGIESETYNEIVNACIFGENKPKFKVGDWIYHNNGYRGPYLITNINEHGVELDNNIRIKIEDCYDYHHLWTIQDAKKGDVLCCESGWTCIFKSLNSNNVSFNSYCFMDKDGWFCERGSEGHTLEKSFIKAYNGNIYPATKEQRDLLFTKMKESGYEWDAEKKELKKIEQNPIDYKDELKKCRENPLYFFDKYVKLKERELNWSKEDERCYAFILSSLEEKYSNKGDVYTWFKSLKQRIGGE